MVENFYQHVDLIRNKTFLLRSQFYLVSPSETTPKTLGDVPEIVNASGNYFMVMMLLEAVFCFIKCPGTYQINDAVTSITAGAMSRLPDLFTHTIELASYIWFYERCHVFEMPLDSVWTWIFTMLAFDMGYYWFHRAAHEINILWAIHQTHHNSQYYNLATAARQAVLQKFGSFVFYLPIGLVVPPPMFAMHLQLNLIYQFWLHTEMIGKLGPLEWILNTPSHHRVHHGRNPYCLDRNYAAFLIIWDRMFGTFQPERGDEPIAYGLVHNINSFDPVYVQINHFFEIWRKLKTVVKSKKSPYGMEKIKNTLKVFFYGPGWFPSKPQFRLGDPNDIPKIDHAKISRYDPPIPTWVGFYCIVHMSVATLFVTNALNLEHRLSPTAAAAVSIAFICSAISFGNIFHNRQFAALFEFARCIGFACFNAYLSAHCAVPEIICTLLQTLFLASALVCLFIRPLKCEKLQ